MPADAGSESAWAAAVSEVARCRAAGGGRNAASESGAAEGFCLLRGGSGRLRAWRAVNGWVFRTAAAGGHGGVAAAVAACINDRPNLSVARWPRIAARQGRPAESRREWARARDGARAAIPPRGGPAGLLAQRGDRFRAMREPAPLALGWRRLPFRGLVKMEARWWCAQMTRA